MSYVIIRVPPEDQPRDLVRDTAGEALVFERYRTAHAYVNTVLANTDSEYRVYKTDRLPEYIESRMKEVA